MATIDSFNQEKSDIAARLRDVQAKVESEGRGLSADEQSSWDKDFARLESITNEITELKKAEVRNRQLTDLEKEIQNGVGTKASSVSPTIDKNAKIFNSMGEQMQAIAKSKISGVMDPRILNAAPQHNETAGADGGFLVHEDFATELMSNAYGTSNILSRVTRTPIGPNSNSLKLTQLVDNDRATARQGGVVANWTNEYGPITDSKMQFRQVDIQLQKLAALTYASEELLEDTIALETELGRAFSEEMVFQVEEAILNGDGAGKPTGILDGANGALITVASATPATTGIDYSDIVNMWSRMHSRSKPNSVWYVDPSLMPFIQTMTLVGGTSSTPVYLPPNGAADAPYGTLMGRPMFETEHTAAATNPGDILLADMSQYKLIEKGGIKTASSIHVQFLTDQSAYRWTWRLNGIPTWDSDVTPANGSGNTLSPFVTLGLRV